MLWRYYTGLSEELQEAEEWKKGERWLSGTEIACPNARKTCKQGTFFREKTTFSMLTGDVTIKSIMAIHKHLRLSKTGTAERFLRQPTPEKGGALHWSTENGKPRLNGRRGAGNPGKRNAREETAAGR
ncbi:MAG: hypothetical protein V8R40_09310 [Dysosmobacter sp.]